MFKAMLARSSLQSPQTGGVQTKPALPPGYRTLASLTIVVFLVDVLLEDSAMYNLFEADSVVGTMACYAIPIIVLLLVLPLLRTASVRVLGGPVTSCSAAKLAHTLPGPRTNKAQDKIAKRPVRLDWTARIPDRTSLRDPAETVVEDCALSAHRHVEHTSCRCHKQWRGALRGEKPSWRTVSCDGDAASWQCPACESAPWLDAGCGSSRTNSPKIGAHLQDDFQMDTCSNTIDFTLESSPCDAVQTAEQELLEIESHGDKKASIYTAVLTACAKAGDVERAEKWMQRMQVTGASATVYTYSAMFSACAKAKDATKAKFWFQKMVSDGVSPNAHSYGALIHACAKAGDVDAASHYLRSMGEAGICADVVVYGAVLDACAKARNPERAKEVHKQMIQHGVQPSIISYATLARPFAQRGDWIQVERLSAERSANGLPMNEYFLYTLLLAYALAQPRQADRAEAAFREAATDGVDANQHVMVALARAIGRARCQKLVAELFPEGDCRLPRRHRRPGPRRSAAAAAPADVPQTAIAELAIC